jgi:hypothetical protein
LGKTLSNESIDEIYGIMLDDFWVKGLDRLDLFSLTFDKDTFKEAPDCFNLWQLGHINQIISEISASHQKYQIYLKDLLLPSFISTTLLITN